MSIILSAPLSLMIVAGTLGVKMELISETVKDSLILTAVITSIVFPALFRPVSKRLTANLQQE